MTTTTLFEIRPPQGRDEMQRYLDLRWEIMHKPFGARQPSVDRPQVGVKPNAYHLAIFVGEDVVATGRVEATTNPEIWSASNVGVDQEFQRTGLGGLVLAELEEFAKEHGARCVELRAAKDAIKFYAGRGYQLIHSRRRDGSRMMYKDL